MSEQPQVVVAERSPRRQLAATLLTLEAIVLGLTTPVMISLTSVGVATAVAVGCGLAVVALLVVGLLRFPWAYWLGWALQAAAIALGFIVSMMFVLGVVFAVLWATGEWVSHKIDRERAAAYAAWARQQGDQ